MNWERGTFFVSLNNSSLSVYNSYCFFCSLWLFFLPLPLAVHAWDLGPYTVGLFRLSHGFPP